MKQAIHNVSLASFVYFHQRLQKPQAPVKKYVESFDGISEKVQNGRRRLGMYDCSRALKALERIPRRQ